MEHGEKNKVVFEVGKNWNNQKMRLKQKYPQLKESDLLFDKGKESEMLAKVGEKLDLEPEEVICLMDKVKEESIHNGIPGKAF